MPLASASSQQGVHSEQVDRILRTSSATSTSSASVGSPSSLVGATLDHPSTTSSQQVTNNPAPSKLTTRRPSTSSSSASSKRRVKSRFLFTSSKQVPVLIQPPASASPTGSKSSSAETTTTQASLLSASSTNNSNSSSTPPELESPPSIQEAVPFKDAHSKLTGSTTISTTSAFVKAIKSGFRKKSVSEHKENVAHSAGSENPSSYISSANPTTISRATISQAEGQDIQQYSKSTCSEQASALVLDSNSKNNSDVLIEGDPPNILSQEPDYFTTIDKMKRQQADMEYTKSLKTDYSNLPLGLSDLCLGNLGLPFLLFDSSEVLVYANVSGREIVPALALSSTSTSTQFEEDDKQTGPSTRQRRKPNGKPSSTKFTKRNDTPSSSASTRSKTIISADIFANAAFDDIDVATSAFNRAPDVSSQFSLARTLQDREITRQSYDQSTTITTPGVAETPDRVKKHRGSVDIQSPASPLRRSESKLSLNSAAASIDLSSTPGFDYTRPPRTRTSTDSWLKEKNQCQPFLRLCEGHSKTWWRTNLTRIDAQEGDSKTSHYYAVLMFQPIVYEMNELVPCDDVSSVKSISSTITRPSFTRTISDPPIIPGNVTGLTEKVEDTSTPSIPLEFYKGAVECMPQVLFTSGRDGIITYLNPQWYSYTGWDMKVPSREMWADVFHPNDVSIAVDKYSEAIRSGSDIHLQYRVKNKLGQYRWMIARGRCIRDDETDKITGFACTLTDGQELIDAQQKAVQTQQYISTVLKASAITLIVIDTTRKVVLFEGYTEALDKLGVTGEEAMGRLLEDAWPDLECAEQAQAMLAQQGDSTIPEREFATTVGPSNFRYRITPLYENKAVDTVPIYDNITPSRKCTGLAIVCTDTSAMVRAEKALVQSQKERAELAAREEAAREASRLKTIFVTSLSHEIRTPISGMLGISELLLRDESLSSKHQALVQKQLQAGEVLLQLVSMVLDLGKLEANKLDLENEPFLISDLMKDLDIFASLADAKNIYFERILHVKQDCLLQGDRLRLAQVLSNFTSNAVKFTSHGGITLRVDQDERDEESLMTFQLEDTGTGIDKETLPHLFKPFHQGNVTIARRFGGSGLGLSIAKTLTELMGGKVTLDSTLGVGTTVRLDIPLRKPSEIRPSKSRRGTDQSATSSVSQEAPSPRNWLSGRREDVSILIAEDNALLQEIYSALVKKMQFGKVRVVEDGILALEEIDKEIPHVVLMDIEMPRMNGPDAVRIIRNHENAAVRDIKIIALTANAVSGDEERFLGMGMDVYLSKPVRAAKLEEAILACLKGL